MQLIKSRVHKMFVLLLLVFGVLAFSGCDNKSFKEIPGCPLCGHWETFQGSRGHALELSLAPDKYEMDFRTTSGHDCTMSTGIWESTGDREGVILLNDITIDCDRGETKILEKDEMGYRLGDYTLILFSTKKKEEEELFIRSGVNIPKQENPLLGKWGVLKEGETPEDYKGKWKTIRYRLWFREGSIKSKSRPSYIRQYIVEDDTVIVVYKSGKWRTVKMLNHDTILLKTSGKMRKLSRIE